MDTTIVIVIVALVGFVTTLVLEKQDYGKTFSWMRLVVLSAASVWLIYVIVSGWKSGVFVLLLLTFFIAAAIKAAWDLWSSSSGSFRGW